MTARDFWSRRRAAVEAEAQAEAAAAARAETAAEHAALEEKTDDEICAELGLPDPDTLQPGDDFAAFLKEAVPERLRRRALRVLWRSNPVLANVDGLVDYGEDFTDSATVLANLSTTYQVGKGMLAHILHEPVVPDPEAAPEELPEEEDAVVAMEEALDADVLHAAHDTAAHDVPDDDPPAPPPIRRRMRFEFDEPMEAT